MTTEERNTLLEATNIALDRAYVLTDLAMELAMFPASRQDVLNKVTILTAIAREYIEASSESVSSAVDYRTELKVKSA